MYTAELLRPRKSALNKFTYLIWYGASTLSIFLIYLVYTLYLQNKNIPLFLLGIIISLMLLILLQEIIISKYMKMFPYWAFTLITGIFLGFLWSILFIGTLIYMVIQSGIFATSLKPTFGKNISLILSIVIMPFTTALIFVIFTYGLWHKVVKPIHKSSKLSEKHKLLFEGIIAIVVSVFSALSIYVALIILLFSNSMVAFIISAFVFSYMTFSGFKEIYSENAFFGVFEIKANAEL